MANTFIDTARILVKSGAGGNGAVAFHREKYVAAGGPDGGDGGRGGDVILQVDDRMSTLMDFRYKRKYVAENGGNGAGKQCSGKNGAPLILKVPRGTVVRDAETKEIIVDMSSDEPFVLCRGGNGGWGNKHFATPTRQTPQFAKAGLPGKERTVLLELKLLADVGLVGFPNVGKSTLLSVATKARPKIANYHFTTLFPNLGVVFVDEGVSFVMADIPGIIEGAAEGAGLGHDFLRHIDRCRLLIHIVDVSGSEGRDPVEDFEAINAELKEYSEQDRYSDGPDPAGKAQGPRRGQGPALLRAVRRRPHGRAGADEGRRRGAGPPAPRHHLRAGVCGASARSGHQRPADHPPRGRRVDRGRPLAAKDHGQRELFQLRVPQLVRPDAPLRRAV